MNVKLQGNLKLGSAQAAAYDLSATEHVTIAPGERAIVKTGVRVEMPDGVAALVVPRSGLAAKAGITVLNAPGLIDPDYRGEIAVILYNTSGMHFPVNVGDRIAQLMFTPFLRPVFVEDALSATARGEGGFGSTGVA